MVLHKSRAETRWRRKDSPTRLSKRGGVEPGARRMNCEREGRLAVEQIASTELDDGRGAHELHWAAGAHGVRWFAGGVEPGACPLTLGSAGTRWIRPMSRLSRQGHALRAKRGVVHGRESISIDRVASRASKLMWSCTLRACCPRADWRCGQ